MFTFQMITSELTVKYLVFLGGSQCFYFCVNLCVNLKALNASN